MKALVINVLGCLISELFGLLWFLVRPILHLYLVWLSLKMGSLFMGQVVEKAMVKKVAAKARPKVYELKIQLIGTDPNIVWRKILVHDFIKLYELHMLIQIVMGWRNIHLFSFQFGDKTYVDKESVDAIDTAEDMGELELRHVLGGNKNFLYTYDFGDDWIHHVEVLSTLDDDSRMNYPVCIGGENACPPENCGGVGGFKELKKILAGKDSDEKDEMLFWFGGYYNPLTFDPNFVNHNLLWTEEDF